jgi:hypothetical protein
MCPKYSNTNKRDWQQEFDRRVKSGEYKTDKGWRMGRRVADDTGKLFTRDGADCCGCGRSQTAADEDDNMRRGPRFNGKTVRNPHGRGWFS